MIPAILQRYTIHEYKVREGGLKFQRPSYHCHVRPESKMRREDRRGRRARLAAKPNYTLSPPHRHGCLLITTRRLTRYSIAFHTSHPSSRIAGLTTHTHVSLHRTSPSGERR